MKVLSKKFYERSPEKVALELLEKILVRRIGKTLLTGKIIETEAYFGREDPASRASFSEKWEEKLRREPGRVFVYMVHNNWMLNIIAHKPNEVGAVLIRALEPLQGIEEMIKHRKGKNIKELCSGPGKLTQALKIDKKLDNIPIFQEKSGLVIVENEKVKEENVVKTYRIGVKKDLPEPMRFYIRENPFVSKY